MNSSYKTSTNARALAKEFLEIKSIVFNVENPFTWVSGIKSPVYCDNRRINSFVAVRNMVVDAFVDLIKAEFNQVEMIGGVATGGIPMGILVADRMNLPFIYVRQEPKKHGMMRQVEGHFIPKSRVVLIEDHISTGGSSLKAVEGLRQAELELLGLISIMTYGFDKASDRFNKANVNYLSLSDLATALEVANEQRVIADVDLESISTFIKNPESWFTNSGSAQ